MSSDDEVDPYAGLSEVAKNFKMFFESLDGRTQSWVGGMLGEIGKDRSNGYWTTPHDHYIQASINCFKIIAPNATHTVSQNKKDAEKKDVSFQWDPKEIAYNDVCRHFH